MDEKARDQNMPVRYERRGEVAVIVIDNPPVNALGHAVRAGILTAVNRALADPEVLALILRADGRTFPAGADIREFAEPPRSPELPDVIAAVESATKLTVAALHGTALGGGLELALGCDYRIAATSTRLGLPEVKLGLVPGAGGTQRLPRLIGVRAALTMIVDGDPVSAGEALASGLVDEIAGGDLVDDSIAYARRLSATGAPKRQIGRMNVALHDRSVIDAFEAETRRRKRGLDAPIACIAAVRAAVEQPFAEGLAFESAVFRDLKASPQARALRHVFMAEREVARVPGLPSTMSERSIGRAAVIGAGTMGGGIAMTFANAGIPIRMLDTSIEALDRGLAAVRRNYEATAKKGRLTAEQVEHRMGLIRPITSYEALVDVDLVIEAVFEELDLKKAIFRRLDEVCRPGAMLASNTSSFDIDEIAAVTARPRDVLGLHFFSPAHIMRLLEVVRGAKTADDVLSTAMSLGKRLGKVAVAVGSCRGFVGNRMLHPRQYEAVSLVEEGASPEQVDRVMTEFGFPMGLFAMSDMAGIDIGWRIRNGLRRSGAADAPKHSWLDAVVERGRHGQKTGAGIYRYAPGDRTPLPDEEVSTIIFEHAAANGVVRRAISDDEVLERCLYVMINEGARILEEGIAARALDIDMVWIHGYGFPRHRGGPMFWADEIGAATIRRACDRYFAATGNPRWRAAPLLVDLADRGGRFDDQRLPPPTSRET